MANSLSGQDEPNRALWLATRAGKMELSCLPAESCEKNFPESQTINPLLTKLFRSRWLDIGLVLFLRVDGPRPRLYKGTKMPLGLVWSQRVWNENASQFKMADEKQSEQRVLRVNQVDLDRTWQQSYSRNQNLMQMSSFISIFSWMQLSLTRKLSIFCDLNWAKRSIISRYNLFHFIT